MAVEIAKVECVEVGDNGKYGRFVVEPLERGFGHCRGVHHFVGICFQRTFP